MRRPSLGDRQRFEILKRDGFRCRYCGRGADEGLGIRLHVDHVQPVALGGDNDDENLITACEDCNLGKGATPLGGMIVGRTSRLDNVITGVALVGGIMATMHAQAFAVVEPWHVTLMWIAGALVCWFLVWSKPWRI